MDGYSKLSDSELVALLRDSDRGAFAEIYERYKVLLHIHAYKKFADREEVKDIIQEVFATLWTNRASANFGNLPGYLYASVRNSIINHFAHQQVKSKYVVSMQSFQQLGQVVTDHLIREKQLAEIIEREISALPPRMKEVFELSRKEHLSHKEIAEKLDISEKTVDRQISNALKILRTKMGMIAFLAFLVKCHYFK